MSVSRKVQCILLVCLAISCTPLSTLLLFFNYLYISLVPFRAIRGHLQKTPGFKQRTILLTGVNTPQGLRLARAFHETGNRVIGADYEPGGLPIHVRFSKALSWFYRLPLEPKERRAVAFIDALVRIVEQEHVDLWINCTSNVDATTEAQARDVIEQTSKCRCFALRLNDVPYFLSREAFLPYLKSQGLPTPEAYKVKSRDEIHNVVNKAPGHRKYMLSGPLQNGTHVTPHKTRLPRRTLSQTYNEVSLISIAQTMPWRLEQDIDGLERYSSFTVVVGGSVKAFAASRCIHPGCYQVLEPRSALSESMLRFVQTFAANQGLDFTTHLGIDFCVDAHATEAGVTTSIFPVELSVQAQTTVLLFHGIGDSAQLTRAYLGWLASSNMESANKQLVKPVQPIDLHATVTEVATPTLGSPGSYCFGQDLLHLVFMPFLDLLTLKRGLMSFLRQIFLFLEHLLSWQDDAYSFRDPLPFWWAYQIYIPLRLVMSALSKEPEKARKWMITSKRELANHDSPAGQLISQYGLQSPGTEIPYLG